MKKSSSSSVPGALEMAYIDKTGKEVWSAGRR
jgi:hypothetical protein